MRARVWVDDVVPEVGLTRSELLQRLTVDPWIHLSTKTTEKGRDDAEEKAEECSPNEETDTGKTTDLIAMSLASQVC